MATIMLGDARLDALVLSMLAFPWQDEEEEHYEVEYGVEEDGLDQEDEEEPAPTAEHWTDDFESLFR